MAMGMSEGVNERVKWNWKWIQGQCQSYIPYCYICLLFLSLNLSLAATSIQLLEAHFYYYLVYTHTHTHSPLSLSNRVTSCVPRSLHVNQHGSKEIFNDDKVCVCVSTKMCVYPGYACVWLFVYICVCVCVKPHTCHMWVHYLIGVWKKF